MIWRVALFVWIAAAMGYSFLVPPLVPGLGDSTRVLYFHVPTAWITVVALGWSMIQSVRYLKNRRIEHDDHAAAAAELGMVFCLITTVTGSIWAKAVWHSWWNWDPRETSIFFLLLIYGAYLALRGAIEGEERRARLAAVYSVAAFVTVPFLVFVVPRLYFSLHPDPVINEQGRIQMNPLIRVGFGAMLVGFTVLYVWLQRLRVRITRLERGFEARAEWGASPEGSRS